MLSEIFLDLRNEAHFVIQALLRYPGLGISIFVHLVTDHIFIYPFILHRLFYFIPFYFIYYLLSTISIFLLLFFHLFCDNLPCSGMFRNVPCPGFVEAPAYIYLVETNLY